MSPSLTTNYEVDEEIVVDRIDCLDGLKQVNCDVANVDKGLIEAYELLFKIARTAFRTPPFVVSWTFPICQSTSCIIILSMLLIIPPTPIPNFPELSQLYYWQTGDISNPQNVHPTFFMRKDSSSVK